MGGRYRYDFPADHGAGAELARQHSTAVLDWMLLRASGREEENDVGRYTDTAHQLESLPLR